MHNHIRSPPRPPRSHPARPTLISAQSRAQTLIAKRTEVPFAWRWTVSAQCLCSCLLRRSARAAARSNATRTTALSSLAWWRLRTVSNVLTSWRTFSAPISWIADGHLSSSDLKPSGCLSKRASSFGGSGCASSTSARADRERLFRPPSTDERRARVQRFSRSSSGRSAFPLHSPNGPVQDHIERNGSTSDQRRPRLRTHKLSERLG
jgi:hypothetical protein